MKALTQMRLNAAGAGSTGAESIRSGSRRAAGGQGEGASSDQPYRLTQKPPLTLGEGCDPAKLRASGRCRIRSSSRAVEVDICRSGESVCPGGVARNFLNPRLQSAKEHVRV